MKKSQKQVLTDAALRAEVADFSPAERLELARVLARKAVQLCASCGYPVPL